MWEWLKRRRPKVEPEPPPEPLTDAQLKEAWKRAREKGLLLYTDPDLQGIPDAMREAAVNEIQETFVERLSRWANE